ncbi:MAG: hypothetical protein H7067_03045 [Burkholderiales bacterium]|nr:hypothetical protein [Opitutaceae bacterium]
MAAVQKKKNFYNRVTSSMPLLVTVIVHVVLIGIAAVVVVQQSGGPKKKSFEASNAAASADKQVEHRLQVARRGGSAGGSSGPVSANRIFSTAENALQMPTMPDLPSMGAGGFGGFSGMGSGVGMGAGTGMATSLGGGTGLGGRGFMSLSFLGTTNQNVSKVVFVVDTSTEIMEPRKGGFQAFSIIRTEIMRLVSRLPPSAQFNVVLYRSDGSPDNGLDANLFSPALVPSNSETKREFFAWMTPVNAQSGRYGPGSAAKRTAWRPKPIPPEAGVEPLYLPPVWARALHVALDQQPDVIYLITHTAGDARRRADEALIARRKVESERRREEFEREMKRLGLDPAAVIQARQRALAKAGAELAALNQRLTSSGKDPIVVTGNTQITRPDVQSAIRRAGGNITLDRTGWSTPDGKEIAMPDTFVNSVEGVPWDTIIPHVARLQRALVPERALLNVFLFVGPDENPAGPIANLTAVARRNGGSFQLLTTKRLQELNTREETTP